MIKHTAGPWSVSEINATGNVDEHYIFIEPNVAIIERRIEGRNDCDMPDARLISAAPELLSALIALRERHQIDEPHHADLCEFCKQADAAIAKAGGNHA